MANLATAILLLLFGIAVLYRTRSIIAAEPKEGSLVYWLYTRMPLMRTLYSFELFVGGLALALALLGLMSIAFGGIVLLHVL